MQDEEVGLEEPVARAVPQTWRGPSVTLSPQAHRGSCAGDGTFGPVLGLGVDAADAEESVEGAS